MTYADKLFADAFDRLKLPKKMILVSVLPLDSDFERRFRQAVDRQDSPAFMPGVWEGPEISSGKG